MRCCLSVSELLAAAALSSSGGARAREHALCRCKRCATLKKNNDSLGHPRARRKNPPTSIGGVAGPRAGPAGLTLRLVTSTRAEPFGGCIWWEGTVWGRGGGRGKVLRRKSMSPTPGPEVGLVRCGYAIDLPPPRARAPGGARSASASSCFRCSPPPLRCPHRAY